jgi:hypothetical protein
LANSNFGLPNNALTEQDGSTSSPWLQWFQRIQNVAGAAYSSGVTADRPTKGLWIGRQFYDTTLNKPVYVSAVNPTVWQDASGAVV